MADIFTADKALSEITQGLSEISERPVTDFDNLAEKSWGTLKEDMTVLMESKGWNLLFEKHYQIGGGENKGKWTWLVCWVNPAHRKTHCFGGEVHYSDDFAKIFMGSIYNTKEIFEGEGLWP